DGWRDAGKSGPKAECLSHIKTVWTDMRPLSLRKQMEAAEGQRSKVDRVSKPATGPISRDDLIDRLFKGDHPVTIQVGPDKTARALMKRMHEGFVRVKFSDTRGGTDLPVMVDSAATDLTAADFEQGTGVVRLEGSLTLNYVKVRCAAT